tara:strand:- start:1719 stop:2447 length:729 start_codon:yes stop_codon:yes gene_type:complete
MVLKFSIIFFIVFPKLASASFDIVFETGALWQQRNDVRIPNTGGTRLNFDEFDSGPFFHYRAELFWHVNDTHNLRAVYAPLNLVVNGQVPYAVNYDNVNFNANQDIEIDYTFNSYRLTYYYSFWGNGDNQLNLGITGKVRDAKIQLQQGSTKASYDNVGFVPLIYFEYQKTLGTEWLFHFNMDAAAASQGRAFDVSAKLRHRILTDSLLGIGLRSLEGGADNDEVYTFSWVNYLTIDFLKSF